MTTTENNLSHAKLEDVRAEGVEVKQEVVHTCKLLIFICIMMQPSVVNRITHLVFDVQVLVH